MRDYAFLTAESDALSDLLLTSSTIKSSFSGSMNRKDNIIYRVNDLSIVPGHTPKERILNALNGVK